MNRQRNYLFLDYTESLCNICLKPISAKIIEKDKKVYISKYCKIHGDQLELLEDDVEYYQNRNQFNKPGTISKTQTKRKLGCPFDCGLCPDHDQHTCIGLIEITNKCDLVCPLCYANSAKGEFLKMSEIEKMMDLFIDSEYGQAEILQISGGEPTTHPNILEIISMAKNKGIKHVMLNSNGLRISNDESFVKELSKLTGGFEVYLQMDGFEPNTYKIIRGKDITIQKLRAIEVLEKYGIPVTYVSTICRGINEDEVGNIITDAISRSNVRGVNFQPVAYFGRMENLEQRRDRVTLTGVLKLIEKQTSGMIKKSDFVPLPCDVDRVAVSYLYKNNGEFIPLMRSLDIKKHLNLIRNTFNFTAKNILLDISKEIASGRCNCFDFIKDLLPFLPPSLLLKNKKAQGKFINENTFRISVTQFVDRYNFDMKSMKKECVHIITPDLKKIPFSAYNIIHRDKYQGAKNAKS